MTGGNRPNNRACDTILPPTGIYPIKAHRKPASRRRKTQPVACIAQDGVVLTAEGSGHRALGIGQVGFFRKDPLIDAFLQEAEDRF